MKQRTLVLGVRLGVIAMSGLYGHLVVKKLNNEKEINRRFVHKTAEQIRKVKEESSEENAKLAYTYVLGLREKIFRLVDKVEDFKEDMKNINNDIEYLKNLIQQ